MRKEAEKRCAKIHKSKTRTIRELSADYLRTIYGHILVFDMIYLYCEKWRKTQLIKFLYNICCLNGFVIAANKIRNQQMVTIE